MKIREAKVSVVNVLDDEGNELQSFLYVNREMVDMPLELVRDLENSLPTECLNSVQLSDLVPVTIEGYEDK
jgi:hypothetical protein